MSEMIYTSSLKEEIDQKMNQKKFSIKDHFLKTISTDFALNIAIKGFHQGCMHQIQWL